MSEESAGQAPKPKRRVFPWLVVLLLLAADGFAYQYFAPKLESAKALADANGQLEEKVAALEKEKASLAEAKDALAKDVAEKDDELAKLKGTYDALEQNMQAEIAKGDIQLSEAGGKLKVDLVDKLLFDSGEATISQRGQEVLRRVGAVLGKIEDKQIQVSGHTDEAPISPKLVKQFPTNWELSAARAVNVVRFLSEEASVPARRLVASGYGSFHPIASNATPQGRARNRRIEILLTPMIKAVKNEEVAAAARAVVVPAKPAPAKPKILPAKAKRAPAHAVVSAKQKAHPVATRGHHPAKAKH